jgi:hypothetical protein
MSRYRYTLAVPGDTRQPIEPLGIGGLRIQSKKEGQNLFFRRKLNGPIMLSGADFDYWYSVESSPRRCIEVRLIIEKYCGGVWREHWRGVFSSTDCKPDLDAKKVSITVDPDDAYRVFLNNLSKEFNILEVTRKVNVSATLDFDALFEFKRIDADGMQNEDDADTWALFLQARYWVNGTLVKKGVRANFDIIFRLKRTAPYENGFPADLSSESWVLIEDDVAAKVGTYAKPPDLYNFKPFVWGTQADWYKYPNLLQLDPGAPWDNSKYIEVTGKGGAYNSECGNLLNLREGVNDERCKQLIWNFSTFNFTRNRRVIDVVCFLVGKISPDAVPAAPEAVSRFFTSSTNYVTKQANKLIDLAISQKSDILSQNVSSEAATKGMLSLKALLDELCAMFRVFWYIDTNGKFQLEHESFFSAQGVFSLLRPQWVNDLKNTRQYEYNKTDMPRYERLTFAEAFSDDFEKGEIEYTSPCVNMQEGQDTSEVTVSKISTDIEGLLVSAGSSKEGFVLLAHDKGTVYNETGDLTGKLQANGHLAAANLVKTYWRYNRVMITGKVNGRGASFESTVKVVKQTKISVLDCCEYVNPFANFETSLTKFASLETFDEVMLTGAYEFVTLHEAPGSRYASQLRSHNDAFNQSFS